MPDTETLDERLQAVERTLTGTDHDLAGLADAADLATRLDDLEARLDDVESQLTELEASTQAVRGYVGNVRAVEQAVEQRADAALAKAEQLERRLDEETGASTATEQTCADRSNPDHRDRRDRLEQSGGGRRGSDDAPRWTREHANHAAATESREPRASQRQPSRRRDDGDANTDADGDDGGFLSGLTGSL